VKRHDLATARATDECDMSPATSESGTTRVMADKPSAMGGTSASEPRGSERADATAAVFEAQKLAFAPVAFAVAKAVRDLGVLATVQSGGRLGRSVSEIVAATDIDEAGIKMMIEASLSFGLVQPSPRGYAITKVGFYILNDPMTRANMDFIHDVCFQGMFHFQEAVKTATPAGLKALGSFSTIYEGLSKLEPQVLDSWLTFDHYYSDLAFPEALPFVFDPPPARLLDVGGNTGKFALTCCRHDPAVKITIVDHPGQIDIARRNAEAQGYGDRVSGHPIDVLDDSERFPKGYDVIWMSQFLVCFSEREIVSVLRRAREAMGPTTRLFVLDTFWDRQENEVATYCLHGLSPYFTCLANGNSRVYSDADFMACAHEAGLTLAERHDGLGLAHSLLRLAAG
jgi:ubiquinone/menaquinone biosynthesis C-methylase UbiE